jgi:hypothetical protein
MCTNHCMNTFSFLLGKYLGLGCLGHIIAICLAFLKITSKLFSTVVIQFFTPASSVCVPVALSLQQHLV